MVKALLPLVFAITNFNANALEPKNFSQDDSKIIQNMANDKSLYLSSLKKFNKQDRFHYYSSDPLNKIDDQFIIPNYFLSRVHFWFNIYTLYSSSEVLVHDKDNLDLIYDVLDYQKLMDSSLGIFTTSSLRTNLSIERINEIKIILSTINEDKEHPKKEDILERLKIANIQIPEDKKERNILIKNLIANIRAQTGQKNFIEQGVINFLPYEKILKSYFDIFNLPFELVSIPFLESSFNTKAKSKVGATGPWQFMDGTGKSFMIINNIEDQRVNPIIASLSAMHLLTQNKKILKTWDLAVSAYNSGTKHYVLAKRKFNEKNVSLEDILKYYDHPHIGFASSNFYSEFLALVYTLAYKDNIYDIATLSKNIEHTFKSDHFNLYIAKCTFNKSNFKDNENFPILNTHLLSDKNKYKRGTLIISDQVLDSKKYYLINKEDTRKNYPKNYFKLMGKSRCGKT